MFFYLIPEQTRNRLDGESRWSHLKRLVLRGNRQLPSGGVKVIYQHCDILNKNGIEAFPVFLGDFKVDWFPHDSNAINLEKAKNLIKENDVLICPEIIPVAAEEFLCRNKIAFIQNWALVDIGATTGKRYEDFGFTELLSCSTYIENYMQDKSSLKCSVVVNGINLDLFRPEAEKRVKNSVLYLNRRNVNDARLAIAKLPEELKNNTQFIELENKYSQEEIIKFYQAADVFMSIGYPEGFALPPLEAMACGCSVIGFSGGGGLEHMNENITALIAPDGDITRLSQCLEMVLTNKNIREKIRSGGLAKAKEFSLKRMEDDLLKFALRF